MSGKRLLKGMLAQTGSINRLQEEQEMWRLREMEKTSHWGDFHVRKPRQMISRHRLLSDSLPSPPPRHTSPHSRPKSRDYIDHTHLGERESDSYWTRRLLKQEESDPDRWGHSGYRELYAEEFASSEERQSDDEEDGKHDEIRNGHSAKKNKKKSESGRVRKKRKRRDSDSSDEDKIVRKKKKDGARKIKKSKKQDGKKKSGRHKH